MDEKKISDAAENTERPAEEKSTSALFPDENDLLNEGNQEYETKTSTDFESSLSSVSDKEKDEIKPKWNWGAFSFPLFFGIAHRAYLGLLILLAAVPWVGLIFAIIWMIVFGFNGEKWALENPDNQYRDNEEFRKVMDGWNRSGFVGFIIGIVIISILIIIGVIFIVFALNHFDQIQDQIQQQSNFNY